MSDDAAETPRVPSKSLAVALHYSGRGAPRVVAKGGGLVADNIIATAREHGVPIDEDPGLAGALSRVELGREIPRELYVAVAQVLAFAWVVSKKINTP
ncbi:MAG: EscU/YscU/HrcU family type III secretion system export apparatus switch protein [Steroidobacteraceae bacterium]